MGKAAQLHPFACLVPVKQHLAGEYMGTFLFVLLYCMQQSLMLGIFLWLLWPFARGTYRGFMLCKEEGKAEMKSLNIALLYLYSTNMSLCSLLSGCIFEMTICNFFTGDNCNWWATYCCFGEWVGGQSQKISPCTDHLIASVVLWMHYPK